VSDHFQSVRFKNYKALKNFSINLDEFNVLVGPNNAGKTGVRVEFPVGVALLAGSCLGKNRQKQGSESNFLLA